MKTTVFTYKELEPLEEKVEHLIDAESLYVLLNSVRQSYNPENPVICMAIGCDGSTYEGTIIREFHKERLGLDNGQLKVIGCDRYEVDETTPTHDYDLYFGGEEGDAKGHLTWLRGIIHFDSLYKFVFMNHPSVPALDNWIPIYNNALSFVAEDGVIATVCEGIEDRTQLITLSRILKKDPMVDSRIKYFCRTDWMLGPRQLTFLELRRSQPRSPD